MKCNSNLIKIKAAADCSLIIAFFSHQGSGNGSTTDDGPPLEKWPKKIQSVRMTQKIK